MTFNHGSALGTRKRGYLLGKYISNNGFTLGKDKGCSFHERHSGLFFKTILIPLGLIK